MPTLNYDPTEADQPEFTEEELDSLKVGEQATAEHDQLLAGKFEDAEQLEKAYIELQKKLGQPNAQEQEELRETETAQEVESNPILDLIDEARTSDDFDLGKFKDLDPQEVAKTFLDNTEGSVDLTEQEVNFIKGTVGGEEAYGELMEWANETLDAAYVQAFDKLVETGNGPAISLAVAGLMAQYEVNNGRDGELLSGKGAPPPQADVFRSQAEVIRAMNDPRYDSDPAYRNDVFEKLGRSNLDTY